MVSLIDSKLRKRKYQGDKRVLLTDGDLLKGEKRLCLKQENDLIYIENKVKTKITPNPNVTMKSLMINRRET